MSQTIVKDFKQPKNWIKFEIKDLQKTVAVA